MKPSWNHLIDYMIQSCPEKGVVHKWKSTDAKGMEGYWPTRKKITSESCLFIGFQREMGELIKQAKNQNTDYYYGDQPYIVSEKFPRGDKKTKWESARWVKNGFNITEIQELTAKEKKRIEPHKKNIIIEPWKKDGKHILLCCPSTKLTHKFPTIGSVNSWTVKTILKLQRYTDRPIKIRMKQKEYTKPLIEDLKDAYACVTFQSTASIQSICMGVPSFCGHGSCAEPVSKMDLSEIENPLYSDLRSDWINTLLANQFTTEEMKNGYVWSKLK